MKDFINWLEYTAPDWCWAVVVYCVLVMAIVAAIIIVMIYPPALVLYIAIPLTLVWREYKKGGEQ